MPKSIVKVGMTVGNGAALNIQLGWVPNYVSLANATDGDLITTAYLQWVIPFSSGGTNEIVAGSAISGATSAATAIVEEVLLYSGTWAGGDAAGFLVVQEDSLVGTFGSENVYITNLSSGTATINDATVTANVVHNVAIAAAAAGATTTSAISRYEGSAGSASKGFTIGSVIAEEAKLLRYFAVRNA